VIRILADAEALAGLRTLILSLPNVTKVGYAFGSDPALVAEGGVRRFRPKSRQDPLGSTAHLFTDIGLSPRPPSSWADALTRGKPLLTAQWATRLPHREVPIGNKPVF